MKDAEVAEKLAESKLKSRQEALAGEEFDKELSKIAATNDGHQRKISALRQVKHKILYYAHHLVTKTVSKQICLQVAYSFARYRHLPSNLQTPRVGA